MVEIEKEKTPLVLGASWKIMSFKWKLVIVFLSILCLVLLGIVIALALSRGRKAEPIVTEPKCTSMFPLDLKWPEDPRVFQDLNEKEVHAVRDFLLSVKSLSLTKYEDATLADNFIYLIELHLPNKSSVLKYLDNNGPKPMRYARVILMHGAEAIPFVEEYVVFPVSKPKTIRKLRRAGMRYPIPYFTRPDSGLEVDFLNDFILKSLLPVKDIIEQSFGGYSIQNCGNKCLVPYRVGFPGSKDVGLRQDWIPLTMDQEGADALLIPFAVLVEHADRHVSNWEIKQVDYHNQLFPSIAEFASKYRSGKVKKYNTTMPPKEQFRATMRKRGKSFLKTPLRGPELVEPNGRRFSVLGRKITYMPWEFEFGFKASKGLTLYNVKFDNRRILYELGIQDAVSFYSSADATTSVSNYLDSFVGMAKDTLELLKGVDCPFTAVYLDNIIFTQGDNANRIKNCICVFESYGQIAARRHRGWPLHWKKYGKDVNMEFMSAMADYALVIRTITTAENYDYIFDYVLHLNGVIEVVTSTAGYLVTSPYTSRDDDFGFQNFFKTKGPLHDHMISYKVDLDVDGVKNSYQTLDITLRNETIPWNKAWTMTKKTMKRNLRKTELDSRLYYDFNKPRYYVFQNPNVKNQYGNDVGYRIQLNSMVKQMYPENYFVTKSSKWSKYQMAVTKYKDNEQFSASIYNMYGMEDPVFNFDTFLNDNENIVNEDLVSWVSIGGLHIPNTEDIPTTFTTGNHFSFTIRPFGFFLEDPTMGSSDAVFVTPSKDRQTCCVVDSYGTPEGSLCPVPKAKYSYGGK